MFEKVKPYMGNYMLYTKKAVACIAFATLCSVVPYFLLYHSDERQRASQELTDAVIEFTEGIGIIKTYNMVGERSKVLTNSFTTSCDKSINFEKSHSPWQIALNMTYAVGTAAILLVASYLYQVNAITLTYYIGFLFFVFELFGPLKAFYGQINRLTVMNSCLDRIEAVFQGRNL